jgi:transmembrane sensor
MPHRRQLMLDRGEALFTVAHDRGRPFEVQVGNSTVTAVGTVFDIKRNLDQVTVTVTDGIVDVRPLAVRLEDPSNPVVAVAPWPATHLAKGQEMTLKEEGGAPRVTVADVGAITGWRDGRLEYRHTPLKYVVSDVNRYFKVQIMVGDTAAAELAYSGAIFASQPVKEWLRALESIFPVTVVQTDAEHVLIRSRTDTESKGPATP